MNRDPQVTSQVPSEQPISGNAVPTQQQTQVPQQNMSDAPPEEMADEEQKKAARNKKFLAEKFSKIHCSCGFNKLDEEDSCMSKFISWLKSSGDKINSYFEATGAWFSKTCGATSTGVGACIGTTFIYIIQALYCIYSVYSF